MSVAKTTGLSAVLETLKQRTDVQPLDFNQTDQTLAGLMAYQKKKKKESISQRKKTHFCKLRSRKMKLKADCRLPFPTSPFSTLPFLTHPAVSKPVRGQTKVKAGNAFIKAVRKFFSLTSEEEENTEFRYFLHRST